MTLTNNLKKIVDQPVWEWARNMPVPTTVKPSTAISDWQTYFVGGTPRYAYYICSTLVSTVVTPFFYRYDTWTDSWTQLSTMTVTPQYSASIDYSPSAGYYGRAIGPGPGRNTIQLAAINSNTLIGYKIAIIAGTGAGQERTITEVIDNTVHDMGSVITYSLGPNPATIADTAILTSRKTWGFNQWRDYQVRIAYTSGSNTGASQVRKILYNDRNTLAFSDYNYAALHSWYAAPLATGLTNLAAWYQIESSIVKVDSNWATPPDSTSKFVVKSGGLWIHTGLTTGAFYTLAYYDILADVWYYKGTQTLCQYSATWDTYENALEVVTEAEGGATTDWSHATPLTSNQGVISTAATPYDRRTLTDSGQNMNPNQYANQMIKITGGTGRGQSRTIISNSRTTFVVSRDWEQNPGAGSTYQVIGNSDSIYILPGRAQSVMNIYNIENDISTTGRQFDFGVSREIYVELAPRGVEIATVTNGGTGGAYAVGDILTLTNNGNGLGCKVRVETLTGSQVATVSIWNAGAGYTINATAYATTSGNEGGGNGSGCTITPTSVTSSSQPPIGVSSFIAKQTSGSLYTATVNAAGTGYSVGDLLTVSGGGANAIVKVTSVTSVGGVSTVSIEHQGTSYSTGTGVATSFSTATVKNGLASELRTIASGCTLNTTITDTSLVTTGINHGLKVGDIVFIGGTEITVTGAATARTGQSYFGGLRYVCGTPSATTFTYSIAGPAAGTAATVTPLAASILTNGVLTAVVAVGGTGYSVGDEATINGGTTASARVRVVAVNGGVVTGVSLVSAGSGSTTNYSAGTSGTTKTGGGGDNALTVTITVGSVVASGTSFTVSAAGQNFGNITSAAVNASRSPGTGLATVSIYNGGSGYAVGDLLSVSGGCGCGILRVLTTTTSQTTPAGAVLTAQIVSFGNGYAIGTQKATTNLGNNYATNFCGNSGGGTGCTVNIDSVGSVYATSAGNGLLVNVTGVSGAGSISTAVCCGGYPGMPFSSTGYTATAQTLVGVTSTVNFVSLLNSTTQIVDISKNWIPNEHLGKLVQTQLPGVAATAQMRRIIANSAYSLVVQPAITAPTLGRTKYAIFDIKSLGTEATVKPSDSTQYTWGIATGGSSNTLADNGTGANVVAPFVGGSGYSLNDILTLTTTGSGCTVKVTGVNSGSVTNVQLISPGTGYTTGLVSATTVSPSGGTGCTIQIVSLNAKNWDVNRWAGYKLKIIAGTASNSLPNELLIASNTANTITLANNFTFSASPDSTTVYSIMDNYGVCVGTTSSSGILTMTVAVGGTGYRIGDILLLGTGVGCFVKVTTVTSGGVVSGVQLLNPGSGYANSTTYSTTCLTNANASGCTLTSATISVAGGTTVWNDPYQNWGAHATIASSPLVNKMIRATAGSTITGADQIITSMGTANSVQATTQIVTAATTAPDGNTAYSILGVSTRSAAVNVGVPCLYRLFGTTVMERARYMISWRGNVTPSVERYDITQDMWESLSGPPAFDTYTLGSMFIYNGKDRIYITKDTTGRVSYYDLTTNKIVPCSWIPYTHSTGIQGSRMFVMSSTDLFPDGLEYLYVMRHTGSEMWRSLIYF